MGAETGEFGTDAIGNVRFEFFTHLGSISLEVWRSTHSCKVTTFSRGLRRRTEVRLDDGQWGRMVRSVCASGFWRWLKRYDSSVHAGFTPSWSFSAVTDVGWYYSSGDGEFPDGFAGLLRGMVDFATEIEGTENVPAGTFLSPFMGDGEARHQVNNCITASPEQIS